MPVPKERRVVLLALASLVLLAIGLRLFPVVFVPSVNWADEIFQATEPAHRLVYGYWHSPLGIPGRYAVLVAAGHHRRAH